MWRAVVAYLATDGLVHVWDTAERGGTPLCNADVFYLSNQPGPDDVVLGAACWDCVDAVAEAIGL